MRLVVLLGIAALGCRAAVPYDRLRVELSTTSEWVEVDIEGAEVLVDWWAPEYMIPDVYTDAGLRLEQPWQMAVPLSVTFDLIVSPSSGPDEPRWSLSHGAGGQSSVVVLALAGDGSQPTHLARASLHELREGEDSATRTVVVPAADVVACAAPSAYCIDPESGTYAVPETHLDLSYAAVPTVDPALLSLDLSLPARDRSAAPRSLHSRRKLDRWRQGRRSDVRDCPPDRRRFLCGGEHQLPTGAGRDIPGGGARCARGDPMASSQRRALRVRRRPDRAVGVLGRRNPYDAYRAE